MTNYQQLTAMHQQLEKMWEEVILMQTNTDPVAKIHKDDAKALFCRLIIAIGCMEDYEN